MKHMSRSRRTLTASHKERGDITKECAVCHRTSDELQVQYCTKYSMYLCSKHKNQLLRHGRITDGEKENRVCSVCGSNTGRVHWLSKANMFVCNKHRSQYNRLGYFLDRTKKDKNIIKINDEYAEILFENADGDVIGSTIIDKEDVGICSKHKWYMTEEMGNTRYVKSVIDGVNTSLHRYILNAPNKTIVDHINRNGLDNRKQNLRFVTYSENCVNSKTNSSSGEKNIYKRGNRYIVDIRRNYKKIYYKSFTNIEDAISSRDKFIAEYNELYNRKV